VSRVTLCEVRSREKTIKNTPKKKYSDCSEKKWAVMNPVWHRMKKRSPSSGQNSQLAHWWLLVHSGRACISGFHFLYCQFQLQYKWTAPVLRVNREERRLPKLVELVIPILTSGNTAGFTGLNRGPTLRASPPHTGKRLLYFRVEYCLMITVPAHKCHKSPFKHSKTIYVFTSGWVIVTVQIHDRKKLLKALKWPLQNGPSTPESSKI